MKYEITKETILKYNMKKEFPEMFELVVGRWYKNTYYDWLMNYQGKGDVCYGFNSQKLFSNDYLMQDSIEWREATAQEIFEALKNEALKRFEIGNFIESAHDNTRLKIIKRFNFKFFIDHNNLVSDFGSKDDNSVCLFYNGKWATVIPTMTKKEAEEKLGVKII